MHLPTVLREDWQRLGAMGDAAVTAWEATRHGSMPDWLDALAKLPSLTAHTASFSDTVTIAGAIEVEARHELRRQLMRLIPWRKGPFALFGVFIDSEWRSNRKWNRILGKIDFAGKRVLDVGSGNGYYGWRMLAAGATQVVGVDPTLLFVVQHAAIAGYLPDERSRNVVLPLSAETIEPDESFDVVSSMGVLYHRRDPQAHIADLARNARSEGELILETLIAPEPIYPEDRYANMRNIGCIPSIDQVAGWLEVGFTDIETIDTSTTTTAEQRTTAWMPFHSLANALDPVDPSRTVEGYPAPRRTVIIARRR